MTNVETPQWVAGSKSREIFDEEQLHLAPGAQSFALFSQICIDHGEGALLFDVDGNRFIDLMAGIGVASLGYAHPKYVAAMQKQVAKIHVGSFTSENRAVLVKMLADLAPGLRSWQQAPFFGHGLGTGLSPDTVGTGAIVDPKTGAPIIFDDQYMNSLVSIGALGLIGVIWFVWGSGIALLKAARRRLGADGDLIAACAASIVGFAAGMLTFDAFSFVQCTLIFFVIAALGLRLRALTE